MAEIKVTLSPELLSAPDRLEAALERAHEAGARAVQSEVRQQIVAKDLLASKALLNSIDKQFERRGLIKAWLVGTELVYGPVMEYGRRPGAKQPPVDAIQRWMVFKGIDGDRSVAFLIARSIGRKGIKGRYPFKLASEAALPDVERAFDTELGKLQSELGK